MARNGWKSDYGISEEGIDMLGYLEALPRQVRRELVATVELICRSQGYLTLHDPIGQLDERGREEPREPQSAAAPGPTGGALAQVIPLRRVR
jgi:hypothetical protein